MTRVYKEEDYREALRRWSKLIKLDDVFTDRELDKRLTDEGLLHGAKGGNQTIYKRLNKLVKAQGEFQEAQINLEKLMTDWLS